MLFKQSSPETLHRILFTNSVEVQSGHEVHYVVHQIKPTRANLEEPIYHFSGFDSIVITEQTTQIQAHSATQDYVHDVSVFLSADVTKRQLLMLFF
jgi:hypothetical protein